MQSNTSYIVLKQFWHTFHFSAVKIELNCFEKKFKKSVQVPLVAQYMTLYMSYNSVCHLPKSTDILESRE